MKKIAFIGTGNLASAMLKGVVLSGLTVPQNIFIYDLNKEKTEALKDKYSVNIAGSAEDAAAKADVAVVAVKPKDIAGALDSIKNSTSFVISTAAGIDVSFISSHLSENTAAVRIMPNINAAVGMAMTAYCSSGNISEDGLAFVKEFCSCFGDCIKLDENLFSAFTAVAGSAPAFVYEFINDLAFAGVKNGMPRSTAFDVAVQTVLGSAKAVKEMGLHPSQLTDMVCSPAGTTVEGVAALREYGFDNAVIKAVDMTAAKDKSMKK